VGKVYKSVKGGSVRHDGRHVKLGLYAISSWIDLSKLQKEAGTLEKNELLDKSSFFKLLSIPSSDGIDPLRLLLDRESVVSEYRPPIPEERLP